MHALALIAVILAIVGGCLLVGASGESGLGDRGWRVALRVLGVGSLFLTVSIWALLVLAEPAVCEALGGETVGTASERACRNEWGGNGNNDPGESWVPWA
jgi:hypothetical protein